MFKPIYVPINLVIKKNFDYNLIELYKTKI